MNQHFTYSSSPSSSLLAESFTFSAKERDSETGLSYFGSRYYSSDLSIWLSVDPMSDKYASLSPYVYCADNPVMLVDPNGDSLTNHYKAEYDFWSKQYTETKNKFEAYRGDKNADGYQEAFDNYIFAKSKFNDASYNYSKVEAAISNLKKYNYALYETMNNMVVDGNVINIEIFVGSGMDNEGWHSVPMVSECPNQFNILLNPNAKMEKSYTDLGQVLSHELGHLLYIIPHWTDYQKFLSSVDKCNRNGHAPGDESGKEAHKQTQIYIFNKQNLR